MKLIVLFLVALGFSFSAHCQEVYSDEVSQEGYLFLGSIHTDTHDAKFFHDGKIVFKALDDLTPDGLLIGNEFIEALFKHGLYFQMDGYEPFWSAKITKDQLILFAPEADKEEVHGIAFYSNNSGVAPTFFAMFSAANGAIFGTINYVGLAPGKEPRVCEYIIPEYEESLYEVYLSVRGKVYKGCALIEAGL